MKNLIITIIQSNLYWEDKQKNLGMFSQKIASISEITDLIILPEMFTTGFSMQAEKFAEKMHFDSAQCDNQTLNWMKEKAKEKNCVVTGSFMCEENGKFYNRLVWMKADGTFSVYDKRHLFSMGNEDDHYTVGTKKIIEEIKGWKISPLICYDLRFPIWSRNKLGVRSRELGEKNTPLSVLRSPDYDLLIYIANWPECRSHPWKTLLLARAIENQSYVVGLNRIGNDGNDISHSGDSVVINAKGEVISKTKAKEESIETISISYDELMEFRKAFPVIDDSDNFQIIE